MGGSSSREHRRNNPPVVRNQQPHQTPPQQRHAAMPQHLNTQFRGAQQRNPTHPTAQATMSPASRNAIQEGKKVKTLATVEPTSVHFEPEFQLLTFRLTSDVTTFTWYEVHTAVRETIKDNKVVYTPNKPKAAPQRMRLDGMQDDTELAVQLDITNVTTQELSYAPQYPKQRPCVLVIGYTDEDGHESMEHTSIDLKVDATRRVIGQIVETGGACYSAESVFGGDHEVIAGSIVEGEEHGGTSPATGGVIDGDDEDDNLCVICLTNDKDTAVIPCRHLCLCKDCAGTLMQHTPKCPVCRGPIAQLLHMGE